MTKTPEWFIRGVQLEFLIVAFMLPLLFFVLSADITHAAAGNVCNSSSPCQCGIQCNGGGEVANGYNTIDSCSDGGAVEFEWVEDITVTNLDDSTFTAGNTIEIDAYLDCDTDIDLVSFAYNNGSGYVNIYDTTCNTPAKSHAYYNHTLDNIKGNHSIRVIIAYDGATSMICGYDYDIDYSDTDDITFYVQSNPDTTTPSVTNVSPALGTTYEYSPGQTITLSALVNDASPVSKVYAFINWSTYRYQLMLTDPDLNDIYTGSFVNTSDLGTYFLTIFANDSSNNINFSETTSFYINLSTNITISTPVNNQYYGNVTQLVDLTLGGSFIAQQVVYSLNRGANTTIHARYNNSIYQKDSEGEQSFSANRSRNLSQSFFTTSEMNTRNILLSLKKSSSADLTSRIEIRNDSLGQPSSIVLANASINDSALNTSSFSGIELTLNMTLSLFNNTRYWITLVTNASSTNPLLWESQDDSIYTEGNFSLNGTVDLLFSIFDVYRYRTNIQVPQRENTILFTANDSNGVAIISPLITFYNDQTAPEVSDWDFEDPIDYGAEQTIGITLEDEVSQPSFCQIEINYNGTLKNSTMEYTGADTYSLGFTPTLSGNISFRISANDTLNNWGTSSIFSFIVSDEEAPSVSSLTYSPNSSDGIDPNVTITVNVNYTDNYKMQRAILQYRQSSNPNWTNVSMTNISTVYIGNFTPIEGEYVFRSIGTDFSNLSTTTQNTSINAIYDSTWSIVTTGFLNATSGQINENISLGNITITNTGEVLLNFTLNVTSDTAPTMSINNTSFNLTPKNSTVISIRTTTPAVTGEYSLGILINSSLQSASPYVYQLNSTLVSYISGPVLLAEITGYDPSITAGTERITLSAQVKNLGNETATGVNITWTLPTDWTAKTNTTSELGDILVGQTKTDSIQANVGTSTGDKTITITAQSSNDVNDTQAKTVTVIAAAGSGSDSGSGSGRTGVGGSGGGGSIIIKESTTKIAKTEITFGLQDSYELQRGEQKEFIFNITNTGDVLITNPEITVYHESLLRVSLELENNKPLLKNHARSTSFKINAPKYVEAGKYSVQTVFSGKTGTKPFTKSQKTTIVILGVDKAVVTDCLAQKEWDIDRMENEGFETSMIKTSLNSAKSLFVDQSYSEAEQACNALTELITTAYQVKDTLQRLKTSTEYDENVMQALNLAEEAFLRGDFNLAKTRVENVDLLVNIQKNLEEPTQIHHLFGLMKSHPAYASLIFIVLVGFIFIVQRAVESTKATERIKMYNDEISGFKNSIKELQTKLYVDKSISKRMYERRLDSFRKRVGRAQWKIIQLKLKKLQLKKAHLESADLKTEKSSVILLEKKLQELYFHEKIIPRSEYDKMLAMFRSMTQDLDNQIELIQHKKIGNIHNNRLEKKENQT